MYTFIRMIHTYIHIGQPIRLPRVDIYRNIYVRTYVHTYIHTYAYMYVYTYTYDTYKYVSTGRRAFRPSECRGWRSNEAVGTTLPCAGRAVTYKPKPCKP